jgi:putative colanic acid biosynthesis acetyltransferase WcaF
MNTGNPPEAIVRRVHLSGFDNSWFSPGRPLLTRIAWVAVSALFFQSWVPWPSRMKRSILALFGSDVGPGLVLKPRVTIKYPWRLKVGCDCWIGEGAWLDNLGEVSLGDNCCISQGALVETGSHDWTDENFGLIVRPVVVEDGVWIGARALVLPGSTVREGAVVAAGSVFSGTAHAWTVYRGNPAGPAKARKLRHP